MYLLGNNLKKMLKFKKMSRREGAEALGIKESTFSRYIRGERKPNVDMIIKMSEVFGVSTDWLLTGKSGTRTVAPDAVRTYVLTVSGDVQLREVRDE